VTHICIFAYLYLHADFASQCLTDFENAISDHFIEIHGALSVLL